MEKEIANISETFANKEVQEERAPKTTHLSDGRARKYKFEFPVKLDIIGSIIKAYRKMRNLSQENLGALVGVKKSQISKIEKGDKNLTIGTIIKLLKALRARITFKIELENKKELKLIEQVVSHKGAHEEEIK